MLGGWCKRFAKGSRPGRRRLVCGALLVVGISLALPNPGSSLASMAAPTCPAPSFARGQTCVLEKDAVLTEPLALGSSTQLNCHDHRLTPAVRGATGSSSPEVGVLLNGAYGVKVKNCVLEGFDFGVVVVQTKVPPQGDPDDVARSRNRILSNTVSARLVGVLLVDADNAQISGNVVSGAVIGASAQSGGAEVVFAGNRIVGNAFAGLLLGGEALEAVTVTQNVLAENGYGLFFDGEGAEFFGARVSLNDLVGNRVGVGVGEDFSFSAELSVNVRGNYWGHTCEEGGFLAEDSSSRFVTDSHPYGRPVADSDDGDRPVPCR